MIIDGFRLLLQSYLMMKWHYWIPSLARLYFACSCWSWIKKLYVIAGAFSNDSAQRRTMIIIVSYQALAYIHVNVVFSYRMILSDEHEREREREGRRRQDVWISNCVGAGDVIKQSNTTENVLINFLTHHTSHLIVVSPPSSLHHIFPRVLSLAA